MMARSGSVSPKDHSLPSGLTSQAVLLTEAMVNTCMAVHLIVIATLRLEIYYK